MFTLSFKIFLKLLCRNRAFTIAFLACMICAFSAFLFFEGRAYFQYEYDSAQYQETRIFSAMAYESEDLADLYRKISADEYLPGIFTACVSDGKYSGLTYNEGYEYTLSYGRMFTQEELNDGRNAAILGNSFIKSLDRETIDSLGERPLVIDGNEFIPLGSFYSFADDMSDMGIEAEYVYGSEDIPTSIAIPLKTFVNLGLQSRFIRIVFDSSLTSAQINTLRDYMSAAGNVADFSLPLTYEKTASSNFIKGAAEYFLIYVIALISLMTIVVFWSGMELPRYEAYILCGTKPGTPLKLALLENIYLVTFTYAAALLITWLLISLTPSGIAVYPSALHLIVIYFLILAVSSVYNILDGVISEER